MYIQRSPVTEGVLNKLSDAGLLSYSDFCFLLTLISTPIRSIKPEFYNVHPPYNRGDGRGRGRMVESEGGWGMEKG